MSFDEFLGVVNDGMYTYLLVFLLAGVGIFFTIRTKFVQVRLLKDGFRALIEKNQEVGADGKKAMSSFQALMISTASRVGTGNIAGVATAIAAGGPGAVFWMWLMAVLGGASAFIETVLAQIYKEEKNGGFRGGPSYYIERALGSRGLGILFSILLILCFGYGFNGLQAYNMGSSLEYYIPDYANTMWPLVLGIILAVLTGLVIWGGAHRIGFVTSVLVPVMACIYILLGLWTLLFHLGEMPSILSMVLKSAFNFKAITGGFAGSVIVLGIKRGLFSNEAGMGSAPNAAASAKVDHPVNQGLVQTISVFIDTLLICSTTALMLLASGIAEDGLTGIPYVQAAIQKNVGSWGIHFITFSIFAFAFSSVIGNYYYAEANVLFIRDNKILLHLFRATVCLVVFLGAQEDSSMAWNIADITMGLMAIENIVAILLLNGIAVRALKNYEEQKQLGKKPVFRGEDIGITGTIWK